MSHSFTPHLPAFVSGGRDADAKAECHGGARFVANSAALDAYDRAVDHDKGTGFETCQMLLPSQPRSRQKAPTISASRANAPTHKPRLISAMARLEFPPWRLPHAIKAAPAIRA